MIPNNNISKSVKNIYIYIYILILKIVRRGVDINYKALMKGRGGGGRGGGGRGVGEHSSKHASTD